MASPEGHKRNYLYHAAFLVVVVGLFIFLWNAPPETTAKLPHDEIHSRFYPMPKKQAEKECENCHYAEGEAPLPEDHPPKYRCLFCHKKEG